MRQIRTLFILLAMFAGVAIVYAQNPSDLTISTDEQAYRKGYVAGFDHGVIDQLAGLDFNFKHDHKFQSGISWDSETNANFRAGYEQGYRDGYYQKSEMTKQHARPQELPAGIQAFRFGYKEGYNHGLIDREAGLDFNYQHAHNFQSGISFDTFTNESYRAGYKEGYEDGYHGEAQKITGVEGKTEPPEHEVAKVPENEATEVPQHETTKSPQDENTKVTVFAEEGFKGDMQQYDIGRYPSLDKDKIESIQLSGNVRAILFDRPNFQGQRLVIEKDTADLGDLKFASRASSMIVEPVQ